MDSLSGLDKKRLKRWLLLFFLALAIPSGILIWQAYTQLKWQSFHQHRLVAEELAAHIDSNLRRLIEQEESRSFGDYRFLALAADAPSSYLQPSPLSGFPVASPLPGLIGYFQVDSRGRLSTPLLPEEARNFEVPGLAKAEFRGRLDLQNRIREILSRNRLVGPGKPEPVGSPAVAGSVDKARRLGRAGSQAAGPLQNEQGRAKDLSAVGESDSLSAQAAFDRLNSPARMMESREKLARSQKQGKIADFKLDYSYQSGLLKAPQQGGKKKIAPEPKRFARKERVALAPDEALRADLDTNPASLEDQRIHTFESEIDPFEFSLLDSGHFVLFRKVWREGQRFIQGMLIEQAPFLDGIASTAFDESSLSSMSDLIIAFQGTVFSAIKGGTSVDITSGTEDFSGSVLYQTRLSPPLNDFEFIFSVTRLPPGPGTRLVTWIALVLSGVLLGGFILMYRAGLAQIQSVRQQRNFVSAISHELKTPLTSIRMYSELLREGWTSEEKKITYYQYILSESERLTRLINNVLHLAKLGRGEVRIETRTVAIATLMEDVRQKVKTQTDGAGFQLELSIAPTVRDLDVETDPDAFTQIIINLVDNAIKFSRLSERKTVAFGCTLLPGGSVRFWVRDYGPGIATNQMKKIFRLFYRAENELTRETVGTGIGLALVQQLASRMKGRVDVVNQSPGAEFRITLPVVS
ncbi:MAG: sensor histidine kinase [Gammaproteobacteria bacterium]